MNDQISDNASSFSQYSSVGSNYTDSDARNSDLGIGNFVRGPRFSYSGIDLGMDQKPMTNFKKSIEVEKNLHRLSSLQENCSSLNVKNKLRGVIEHSYKIQIQNLMDELNQAKLDKTLLEKKLQMQVKNQIDYISEVRLSITPDNQNGIQQTNANQYQMLLEKIKYQETSSKELEFQVQELTSELKMTKVSQSQQKKQIERLNQELAQANSIKSEKDESIKSNEFMNQITNLQKQLNEYKQKYDNLQCKILLFFAAPYQKYYFIYKIEQVKKQKQENDNEDITDTQKTRLTTESCCSCKNILLTDPNYSDLTLSKPLHNMSEMRYLANKLAKDDEKPFNYLLKNFTHKQIEQIRRFQHNRRPVENSDQLLQTVENDHLSDKENLNILQVSRVLFSNFIILSNNYIKIKKQIEMEKLKKKAFDVDNNSLHSKLLAFYDKK